jgi:peptide/nickel transport system substrate-binding protein
MKMKEISRLERMLSQGKITRREFVSRMSALGLAAAISPALLAGTAQAEGPKKGGRFRLAIQGGATSDPADPALITSTMPQMMNYQSRNNLVEVDHNMAPVPELAESWEASKDAAKWVFKLRKGVEFHNGKTMDSKDVVFSIDRHRAEDSKSAARSLLEDVVEIKAEDKYTVSFTLKNGSADFPFLVSDYHLSIVPDGTTDFTDLMGTGAYKVTQWEPGVKCMATRNPNYFKPDRGHFDEVEILHVADVNARTNALKTGQVDAINRCEKKTFKLLKKMPGVQAIAQQGMKHYTFAMLCDVPPFNDVNVRMALKYAIDRDQFVKQILRGYGVAGNDHPISPKNRYHNNDLPQRKFDPEKAKFYMKKAGLADHTFDLHVSDEGFPGSVDASVLFKESAKQAGINIKPVQEPADGYWSDVWMKKPWCAVYWGGRPTEDWMFSTTYAEDAAWNDTHWKNKRFNVLLADARAELDDNKRRQMYYEMQELCHNDGGTIVLAFAQDLQAARDNVRFGELATNWELDGWKAIERWWFA